MTDDRKAICESCPQFRRGQVHAETWCAQYDDHPRAAKNCEGARHRRWKARIASEKSTCLQWLDASTCPCCRAADNDPVPGPELYRHTPPPEGWLTDPARNAAHVAGFREMFSRKFTPPDNLRGDGIIMYGDARVWPMLVVSARMLRANGSKLPLQIWRVGPPAGNEMDDDPLTTVIDLDYFLTRHQARKADNWATKTFAIAHSGFARVLFIDPDAYCVADPAPLFSFLDDTGFAFWPDLAWFSERTYYDLMTPLVNGNEWSPAVQGGHYLIDCRRAWRELMLERWYENHADFWWRRNGGEDQGGWRLVLTAIGDYRVIEPAEWHNIAFICRDSRNGHPHIVHRCQGKWWRGEQLPIDYSLPQEEKALAIWQQFSPESYIPPREESREAWIERVREERRRMLAGSA